MSFRIKTSNCSEVTTEGFSPTGYIDAFYNWNPITPCCIPRLGDWKGSAAPLFFDSKANNYEAPSSLSKTYLLNEYPGDLNDIARGEDSLQVI
jgi:hypothetical protein